MAPTSLHTLVPELQLIIIEYIPRPTDLKNLCLTSKAIRNIATPRLYREVTIDLKTCKHPLLNGFFWPSNIGQRFVRKLFFEPLRGTMEDWDNALKVVRFALGVFLPDQFEGDLDLLLLLASRQRNITDLSLGGAFSALEEAMLSKLCPSDWPKHLVSLTVAGHLQDLSSIRGYGQIIRQTRLADTLLLDLADVKDSGFEETL
ncbi:hypothetical protein LTR36_000279 [Oleoguttula mirabilis]|uniref:F-box domain-containing protein n=1 Tax=Oleoguttula mirabilis TaxID=1507867 RepID=A0AAV9JYL3_9PEZI|nr:hypothetical protein LTR36_000279 [Oleoguttula mirabilis]